MLNAAAGTANVRAWERVGRPRWFAPAAAASISLHPCSPEIERRCPVAPAAPSPPPAQVLSLLLVPPLPTLLILLLFLEFTHASPFPRHNASRALGQAIVFPSYVTHQVRPVAVSENFAPPFLVLPLPSFSV